MSWEARLLALVERRIGLTLGDGQAQASAHRHAVQRAAALGLATPADWVRRLEREPEGGPEFTQLIPKVAIGHTSFFRDPEQFDALRALMSELRPRSGRPLWLWSAACSSGEEPWSVAMLCEELGLDAHILATDVNPEAVKAARAGRYGHWAARGLPSEARARWFERDGEVLRVRPTLRRRVSFRAHNLLRPAPPRPQAPGVAGWDLVLLRNVLLYFSPETAEQVVRRLAAALHPRGWLLIGASESLHGLDVPLAPRRVGARVAFSPSAHRVALGAPSIPPAPPVRGEPTANPRAAASLQSGHAALRAHRFDEALGAFRAVWEADPVCAEAHLLAGLVHRKRGALRDAATALQRALFLMPRCWQAAFLLAGVCERLGRDAERRRHLAYVLELLSGTLPVLPISSASRRALGLDAPAVRRACEQALIGRMEA